MVLLLPELGSPRVIHYSSIDCIQTLDIKWVAGMLMLLLLLMGQHAAGVTT